MEVMNHISMLCTDRKKLKTIFFLSSLTGIVINNNLEMKEWEVMVQKRDLDLQCIRSSFLRINYLWTNPARMRIQLEMAQKRKNSTVKQFLILVFLNLTFYWSTFSVLKWQKTFPTKLTCILQNVFKLHLMKSYFQNCKFAGSLCWHWPISKPLWQVCCIY